MPKTKPRKFQVFPVGHLFSVRTDDGSIVRTCPDEADAKTLAHILNADAFAGDIRSDIKCPKCRSLKSKAVLTHVAFHGYTLSYDCTSCGLNWTPDVNRITAVAHDPAHADFSQISLF